MGGEAWGSYERGKQEGLDRGQAEIDRLTRALHKVRAHPDYEYETVKTARKAESDHPPDDRLGWEPNFNVVGVPEGYAPRNWERHEFHEDNYWMRRKI